MTLTMAPLDLQIKRSVVSEITFSNKISLDQIKTQLRRIKATGKLIVNVSQGGVNTVYFEARNSLDGQSHVELLFNTPDLP